MDAQPNTAVIEEPNPFAERAAQVAAENGKKAKVSLLSSITTRKRRRPIFALLYGPPGVGKSSFGASLPKPLMIPVERGLDQITVAKFPTPKTFLELWKMVVAFDTEEHDYQSLVIDTIDATELLIFDRVIEEGGPQCNSIETYGGGYGKGYARAREIWAGLLSKLNEMSERFNILLIAHSQLRTINDPTLSATFDQYRIRIHDKSADVVRQMVDLILFANLEINLNKETPKARKGRGVISGDRLMYTAPTTGVESKNRFNLENPMPFEWSALAAGIDKFYS